MARYERDIMNCGQDTVRNRRDQSETSDERVIILVMPMVMMIVTMTCPWSCPTWRFFLGFGLGPRTCIASDKPVPSFFSSSILYRQQPDTFTNDLNILLYRLRTYSGRKGSANNTTLWLVPRRGRTDVPYPRHTHGPRYPCALCRVPRSQGNR